MFPVGGQVYALEAPVLRRHLQAHLGAPPGNAQCHQDPLVQEGAVHTARRRPLCCCEVLDISLHRRFQCPGQLQPWKLHRRARLFVFLQKDASQPCLHLRSFCSQAGGQGQFLSNIGATLAAEAILFVESMPEGGPAMPLPLLLAIHPDRRTRAMVLASWFHPVQGRALEPQNRQGNEPLPLALHMIWPQWSLVVQALRLSTQTRPSNGSMQAVHGAQLCWP
mmetsp:Transcript_106404/g.211387  ORF Transcript_106404/g.211387 Transcript_106404/m.211387 type:complete len:222 (+) Transcript_106404:350-1015(+)